MRGLRGLGLVDLGDGFFIADEGEDTSSLYEVGALANGAAVFSYSSDAVYDSKTPSTGFNFDSLFNLATTALQVRAQDKILDANIQRANKGLPPLNPQQVSPGVNVGLSAQTQKLVTYGAIGLALVFLLPKLIGR